MAQPLVIDLPHSLGVEEAKRRMKTGIGRLWDHVPGGASEIESSWEGDRMHLVVRAMGQEVRGHIDVHDRFVRLELMLPAFLALLGRKLQGLLARGASDMLEDKRTPKDD
jgi:hypothetical protein